MTTQSTVHPEFKAPHVAAPSSDGRSVKEAIASVAPEVKHKLQQMATSGKSHITEWRGGIQEGIREKPIQYVLIAAAVGATVALLFGRRG